jgi:hypothetical protein
MNAAKKLLEDALIAIVVYAWIIFPGNNIHPVPRSR